jgi:hypothetical protein
LERIKFIISGKKIEDNILKAEMERIKSKISDLEFELYFTEDIDREIDEILRRGGGGCNRVRVVVGGILPSNTPILSKKESY